jgi:hypothetical protein
MRLACLAFAVALSGCYSITDGINSRAMSLRDCCDAQRVWLAYRADYVDCAAYPHYFGEGFKAGYRAVAEGGQGCPPPLPPRKYWSVCYQNEAGKLKILNWYNGHAQGVLVAQQLGVQNRNKLVTGADLYRRNCPVEIVIDPPPSSMPPLDGEMPQEMAPGETLPQPAIPHLEALPEESTAPPAEAPAEEDSVTDSELPLTLPLPPVPEDAAPFPGEFVVPDAVSAPLDEPLPGLPALPAALLDLPHPGEHTRSLSITLQSLWPVSESPPWYDLASPAAAPAGDASDPEAPGRVRLATLDDSVDVTQTDEKVSHSKLTPQDAAEPSASTAEESEEVPQPPDSRE